MLLIVPEAAGSGRIGYQITDFIERLRSVPILHIHFSVANVMTEKVYYLP
jgi:hypothetical protein